jgi:hypothetical protein
MKLANVWLYYLSGGGAAVFQYQGQVACAAGTAGGYSKTKAPAITTVDGQSAVAAASAKSKAAAPRLDLAAGVEGAPQFAPANAQAFAYAGLITTTAGVDGSPGFSVLARLPEGWSWAGVPVVRGTARAVRGSVRAVAGVSAAVAFTRRSASVAAAARAGVEGRSGFTPFGRQHAEDEELLLMLLAS